MYLIRAPKARAKNLGYFTEKHPITSSFSNPRWGGGNSPPPHLLTLLTPMTVSNHQSTRSLMYKATVIRWFILRKQWLYCIYRWQENDAAHDSVPIIDLMSRSDVRCVMYFIGNFFCDELFVSGFIIFFFNYWVRFWVTFLLKWVRAISQNYI